MVQNQRADLARLEAALERVALAVERQGGGRQPAAALNGYVVAGGVSYHQPDCPLPEARSEARMVPLTDIPGASSSPAGCCRPPQFARMVNGVPATTAPTAGG